MYLAETKKRYILGLPTNFSVEVKPFSIKVTILTSPRYIIDKQLPKGKLLSEKIND
ncbi:MAG: hypothetical protein AAFR37_18610 [Cyanobacteria bacterium J06628_3]